MASPMLKVSACISRNAPSPGSGVINYSLAGLNYTTFHMDVGVDDANVGDTDDQVTSRCRMKSACSPGPRHRWA